jgi:FMN phosphatase YigB (HAD superfamily)
VVSAIDCVVFDIGNVLIRWDPRNLYRRMGYSDEQTAAIMSETGLAEINHRRLDAGAPYSATVAELAARFPAHAPFLLAFDTRWTEMLNGTIDSSVIALQAVKHAGIPVHAISNFSCEKFQVARLLFPFFDLFDERIISGEVGMVKPDPEIFELLIERRRLDPGRTLFIDDSADNIATALRLGFLTIHFREHETDLHGELARLGLVRVEN